MQLPFRQEVISNEHVVTDIQHKETDLVEGGSQEPLREPPPSEPENPSDSAEATPQQVDNTLPPLAPIEILPSFSAMAQIACGSSVLIATLLTIPDAVALIPGSNSIIEWAIIVLRVWLTALILWFCGCIFLMMIVAIITGGIKLNDKGIKLWRLAKTIPWNSVEGVLLERQLLFSKLFSLKPPAMRLVIFGSRKDELIFQDLLTPNNVPSFLFSQEKFAELFTKVVAYRFRLKPDLEPVVITETTNYERVRKTCRILIWQRVILSIVMVFGIVTFLGRKAAVNYYFNSGNKYMKLKDFKEAKKYYETATLIDPAYAVAWQGLGKANFFLNDRNNAYKNWALALTLKPDYVEAKESLAYLLLQRRDFIMAKDLIDRAVHLAPDHPEALLLRSEYNLRMGFIEDSIKDARAVLKLPRRTPANIFMARCLLAYGELLTGHAQDAAKVISPLPTQQEQLTNNENLTFRLLVGSSVSLAINDIAEAERLAALALKRAPSYAEGLMQMAHVRMTQKRYDESRQLLDEAEKLADYNPWPKIWRAQSYASEHRDKDAIAELDRAMSMKSSGAPIPPGTSSFYLQYCELMRDKFKKKVQDPSLSNHDALSLAKIASLYLSLNEREKAKAAAQKSLRIVPDEKRALGVLHQIDSETTDTAASSTIKAN